MPRKNNLIQLDKKAEQFIRKNYGVMTKAALARKFGVKEKEFDKWLSRKAIFSQNPGKGKTKDLTDWIRVPVPGIGNPVLLIPPHRDPEKAKQKYLEKINRNK